MEEAEANEPMKGHRARVLAEVVLVFLGILAAFSLESWWADRQERERESALLSAVVAEFEAAGAEAASLLCGASRIRPCPCLLISEASDGAVH